MARVGREVVLDALLVADVDHDVLEGARRRTVTDGDAEAALQHVLQQSDGLQAYRLSAGIGSADDQQPADILRRCGGAWVRECEITFCGWSILVPPCPRAFVLPVRASLEPDVQRYYLLPLLLQRQLQQWVDGSDPVDVRLVFHRRLVGLGQFGPLCLRLNQVDGGQELVGVEYLFRVGPHLVGEHGQDADDLAALGGLQFAHLVVGLYHFGRLDEHGLAGSRLIVNDTVDASLHLGRHGYHQPAVAHGGGGVLVHETVLLCGVQYSI